MKAACDAARRGHTLPACAARAGVSRQTLYRWTQEDEAFAVAFALAKEEGRAALEERALALAEKDDGRHAIELLSRRYPKAWGRSDRVKLDAKVENTSAGFKSNAEVRACLQRMLSATEEEE